MDLPTNHFKRRLREPGPLFGLWVALADPYSAELCAGVGYDWLLLDGEHAPNDLRSLLAQLQSVAAYRSHPVVRPPSGDPNLIKQLLDIGALTLLVPMVETAKQARQLVRATRYPPAGIRGVGSALARASRFNLVPDYLARADAEICLLVQVETVRGLENLDAIAAVDGVDGVFIGPSDLAASMGHLGNPAHEAVRAAIDDAMRRIVASGKAGGILATDEGFARRMIAAGCRFVAIGTDVSVLMRGARTLLQGFAGERDGDGTSGAPPPSGAATGY
ncbi:MAG: 4-hydroxy-2-oxoheptanedioate aldolase [Burkholderiaceae bacterium]|nr:4-hydroxy-2-oxoheptanedioate aldolase [Burkholderiaceae bacterium]